MKDRTQKIGRKTHARGSEQRQRGKRVVTRLTWHEHAQFAANAAKAGLTIPSYVREVGISERETKSRVRRTVDADASMKLIAAMHRIGINVNQIIKRANSGVGELRDEYREALASLNAAIAAVLTIYERRD